MTGQKREPTLLEHIRPQPWPWPGDSKLGQIQRIALSYRELVERNAPELCAELDRKWQQHGHHWVAPSAEPPEREQYVSAADAAHYVSQWFPCDVRLIYKWAQRGHIETEHDEHGNMFIRWGSVVDWRRKQQTAGDG